jgi:cytochrome c
MKPIFAALALGLATPALAEDHGDAEKGAREFGKCKACHSIINGTEVIARGGRTGPNLYGVVGRVVGSEADFRYGAGLIEANATGFVWTEAALAAYLSDPTGWVKEITGDAAAKSKMTFKLKDGADVAAYLASLGPAPAD